MEPTQIDLAPPRASMGVTDEPADPGVLEVDRSCGARVETRDQAGCLGFHQGQGGAVGIGQPGLGEVDLAGDTGAAQAQAGDVTGRASGRAAAAA